MIPHAQRAVFPHPSPLAPPLLLAYNTNGLAHHDPAEAIALLAEIGYRGVGLTIDHGWLNPYADGHAASVAAMRGLLERQGMRSVIETGARFLLDPRLKHEPTLMTADPLGRARRIDFYHRAIDIARELGSDCVSIWSGILREPLDDEAAFARSDRWLAADLRLCRLAAGDGGVRAGAGHVHRYDGPDSRSCSTCRSRRRFG